MEKRIQEFSSGYNDKQATGNKKTLVETDGERDDIKVKGKHLAPMFGGDLLLAADTVTHLAKFNDFIRPPMKVEDVKDFLKSCSNILDLMNSREWKNAQRHVTKLRKFGVNIMNDGNAVDWEQASRRDLAGKTSSSSTLYEMVEAIEGFGLSASYQVKKPTKGPIFTKNILMEFKTVQSDIQEPSPDIVFPNLSDPRVRKWSKQANVITLSPAAMDEVAQGTNVEAHVSGVLFKTVGNLSIPVVEGQGNETVESGNLMSLSVFPRITGDLDPPIRIALAHLSPAMSNFKQDCVFLNASASDGEMWSNQGCKVAGVNETHTICECNHMSSFSLLVDKSQPNDFIMKAAPIPPKGGGGGSGGGGTSSSGFIYIILLFLLIVALIIIIIFAVWRKRKGKSSDEKESDQAKSDKGGDESKAGASGTATEDAAAQSGRSTSSGDKKKRKKGERRKEGRKKRKPQTLDKDAIEEENQQKDEHKTRCIKLQ
ncbi:adhesion G protein-coupled receptor B3-like [Dendronephthya gigantea]|uniref:adhesion G protein-coupled receptor B3-like n=1 Tax=Dendronephthya gigantea TaxID=151771 RepID=UPI00106AA8CE|nr:adhesion G protein-coupled receptor B3-like [Dendronephthya gigantea]